MANNTEQEELNIAIANLVYSGLSLEQMNTIPDWLVRNLDKNKYLIADLIEAEATRRAISELEHVTVYELDDELGAWYEPDEGYQITVANRIAELSATQAKEEE